MAARRQEAIFRPQALVERRRTGAVALQLVRLARGKPLGTVAGAFALVLIVCAVFAPVLAPYDPAEFYKRLLAPSREFLLGTDHLGRDVFSRILWGARTSLYVGLLAVFFGTLVGSLFGLLSGYLGGRFDYGVQGVMDVILAFPTLIKAMVIVALLGPSTTNVIAAVAVTLVPGANRVVRGATLSVRESPYIEAARTVGCAMGRIVFRHVLPNVMAPIIVLVSITLGTAILTEATLSFLGMGPPPPTPTWGDMLSAEGRRYFERAPGLALWPGIAISLTVLSWNLLGDALRDVLDPRLRGTGH